MWEIARGHERERERERDIEISRERFLEGVGVAEEGRGAAERHRSAVWKRSGAEDECPLAALALGSAEKWFT